MSSVEFRVFTNTNYPLPLRHKSDELKFERNSKIQWMKKEETNDFILTRDIAKFLYIFNISTIESVGA